MENAADTNSSSDCFIVSVSHTMRHHTYVSLFRPNTAGYSWPLPWAGRYPREQVLAQIGYYNDGRDNVAVPCSALERLGVGPIKNVIDGDVGPVVPNTAATWRAILANTIAPPTCRPSPQPYKARSGLEEGIARSVIERFLTRHVAGWPTYVLERDAVAGFWRFHLAPGDPASHVTPHGDVLWQGTGFPDKFQYDELAGQWMPTESGQDNVHAERQSQ